MCGQHSTVSPPLIPLAPHPRLHTERLAELWRSKTRLPYFLYQNIVLCVHKHFFFLLELHISAIMPSIAVGSISWRSLNSTQWKVDLDLRNEVLSSKSKGEGIFKNCLHL